MISFKLTANRGSIHNTDIEVIELIKAKLNKIFNSNIIKNALEERKEIEDNYNLVASIEEDRNFLKMRAKKAKTKKIITLPNGSALLEPTKNNSGYSESETLILLVQLIEHYPDLFDFKLKDYNTLKGIDFVIDRNETPEYIELKGTMKKNINHPFRHIHKFICYEIDYREGEIFIDIEDIEAKLQVNPEDIFSSFDDAFKGKTYRSYQLVCNRATIPSMEIIELKSLLTKLIEAEID